MTVLHSTLAGSGLIAGRNLRAMRRNPGSIVVSTIQPLTFVLLIGVVFGGSLGGDDYRQFMMAGILVQTVTFASSFTAIGLAEDRQRGIVDRFRALPVGRPSVMLGRALADLAITAVSVAVASVVGLLIGWRWSTGPVEVAAGYALVLLFAFAMSWVGAYIGLVASNVETAQSVGLAWLFPVTFVSAGFVSVVNLPAPLDTIAEWNPVTAVVTAARTLFGNTVPANLPQPDGWPAQHAVGYALACSVGLTVVFAALATRRYRRAL